MHGNEESASRKRSSFVHMFKIMIFDNHVMGLSELLQKESGQSFKSQSRLSIGLDFFVKNIFIGERKYKLQIWQTNGERRFRSLYSAYCIGANGAIIIYNMAKSYALDMIPDWTSVIRQNAGTIPIMLIGTNEDLENGQYHTSIKNGIDIAEDHKLSTFTEIGSNGNLNLDKMFEDVTKLILARRKTYVLEDTPKLDASTITRITQDFTSLAGNTIIKIENQEGRRACPKCRNDNKNMIQESVDRSNIILEYPKIYGKKFKCGSCGCEWRE